MNKKELTEILISGFTFAGCTFLTSLVSIPLFSYIKNFTVYDFFNNGDFDKVRYGIYGLIGGSFLAGAILERHEVDNKEM